MTASHDRTGSHDVRGPLERDAADGHDRLATARRIPHEIQAAGSVPGIFRRREKHGPDGDVAGFAAECLVDLIAVVRRDADNRVGPDNRPHGSDGEIRLADVDTVGAGQPRDVGAIVDDDLRANGVRRPNDPAGQRRQARARIILVAQLEQARAATKTRLGQPHRIDRALAA